MKYLKYFIFGALLGSSLIAYPIYSFHESDLLENIVPPVVRAEDAYVKEYSFYEGKHYKLNREEILYYMRNTEFNKGNPIKPILPKEKSEGFITEEMPEEITNVLNGMSLPVDEEYFQVSSNYGLRKDPITEEEGVPHWGIDIAAPGIQGSNAYAVMDGVVEFASERSSFGNLVIISHSSGKIKTYYAHLDSIGDIVPGDHISKGQVIGTVGSTGRATGPHLHFEVHIPVNPSRFLLRGDLSD